MIIPNTSSSCLPVMLPLSPQKHERTNLYCQVNEGGSKCPSNIISNNNNISRRPWKNYYHLNYKTCKHFPPTLNNTLNPRGDLSANCIKISLGIAKGLPSTIEEICICKWTRSLQGTGDEKKSQSDSSEKWIDIAAPQGTIQSLASSDSGLILLLDWTGRGHGFVVVFSRLLLCSPPQLELRIVFYLYRCGLSSLVIPNTFDWSGN